MIVTIEVTQADIDAGVREDCGLCPVARAVSRSTKQDVSVYDVCLTLWDRGTRSTQIGLPADVRQFVKMFDAGESVRPFSFTIDLPEEVLK